MATREDALERLNNIKQQRQQNIQERYNNIIKNRDIYIEQQKQLQEQQRQLQEQQKLKDEQRRIEEEKANKISAISKNNTNSKGFNNSRLQNNSLDTSKFNTNIKSEIYNADNLAKKLNISVEDAQRHINNQKQKDENDVLKKLSKNIKNSPVGNSYGGNALIDAIDGFNALGNGDALNIVENVESGITTGVANTISYLSKLDKKVTDKLDSLGTTGKVLAGLTGNLGYAFSKKEDREREYNDTNNWITGIKEFENKKVQKNIESTNSKLTKKVAELSPSMGNNLAGAGLSAINPIAGTAYFVTSASGSYYDDAISRGMNEDQALLYGGVMGTIEGLTEKIAVGDATKAGWLLGKGKMSQFLTKTGISLGENFVQEAIMEPLQETSSLLIGGKNTADFSNMNERMLKAGIDGALSAILMEGATAGVSSAQTVQNKVINNQEVTTQELQQCMKDIQQSGKVDVEKILKQEVKYQTQKAKSTYYDYYTGKKADNSTQNILNEAENIIKRNNMTNLEQNNVKNQNNNQQQQINQIQNKNALNSNIEGQNNYINSAQKYNIDTNNQSVRKIGELANKRGINIVYDDSLFKNNTSANAIYQTTTDKNGNVTRNIILNPNANTNRTLEQIELHEIVHDMYGTEQFNKIKDMVLEYDKGKDGYQEARAGLEELYSQVYDKNSSEFQSLVDEEAVADILGNKLGDQQFVNELVTMKESRSIARKIYDWVVEKLNNMTRKFENMNSYFYWKDVKNKFEEAFRQEYQGKSDNIKYSVMYNNDGTFNRVKIEDDIFKNNNGKSISQTMMDYLKEHIGDYAEIIESGQKVYLGKDLPGEYVHSKSAESLPVKDKLAKGRAVTGLQEIIENAQNRRWEPNKKNKHNIDAKYGFYRYDTNFSFEHNGKEQIYSATILIRNDANGKKYLYDILNLKKIGNNLLPVASNSTKSSAIFGSSNSLPNNSVAQNHSKVNTNTTTQYSMQESENNSGSFNLPKSAWQNRLDTLYKNENKGTRLQDIKLPTKENMQQNTERINNYNGYTEKEMNNLESGKIQIALSDSDIQNFAKKALDVPGNFKMYVSKIKNSVSAKIKSQLGINVEGYNISLKNDAIRHTIVQHSDMFKENLRGQVPITVEDFKNIPEIINNPDNIEYAGKTKQGKPVIRFEKNINGNNVVISYVSDKHKNLEFQTMYKYKKDSAITSNVSNTLNRTSETDNGTNPFINNSIPQNEKNATKNSTNSMFELTNEQKEKIKQLKEQNRQYAENKKRMLNKQEAGKFIKGYAMQISAEIRKIVQGDLLINVEGGLTENELNKKIEHLRSNYVGKEVYVDGNKATIVSNAFGNIKVEFEDGTYQTVEKEQIKPVVDIDNLIKEQEQQYQEYLKEKSINHIPQNENNVKNNKIQVKNVIEQQELPMTEEVEQKRIARILTEPVGKVKPKDRTWAIFKANIFDKGIVFEELSRKADKAEGKPDANRELQGKWDFILSSQARGQNAIGEARHEYDPKTKTRKQIAKSLEDIKTEVGDNRQEFYDYMYHQLNIDRMTLEQRYNSKNKPVFGDSVTAEISQEKVAEYEKKYPEFKEWAQDVYDYNNANKQELVKSGVISQETADFFNEMYPHYVPIKRVDKDGNAIKVPLETNRTGINSPIAKAKGGNSDIQPLFETMAERTLQTYRASARNSFGVELKNVLNKLNQLQQNQESNINVDDIVETLGDKTNADELLQKAKDGRNPTFTVFENGNKITFDVSMDMYDALKPLSDSSLLSKTIKPLNKISNFKRNILTEYNPLFLIVNAIKDFSDIKGNSQHAIKTYAKLPEAYYQILSEGYWYNEYVENGGKANSYFADGKFNSDKKISKTKNMVKEVVIFPFKKISNASNIVEMAPRLAEYIASRKSGRSIEVSMLDAARVTTNFKASGDVTKFANRNGATFLNASVQGALQQIRNIQEAHARGIKGYAVLATKLVMMGLPTILLNHLLWGDDDDYEKLQDYVKDNYYCIAKFGDGRFIRIPKGRLEATVSKIASTIDNYITDKKEINGENLAKDFWEDLLFAGDNLAPNNPIDENIASPIVQAVTNKSWYGEDIVPSRLQDKPAKEQYDETIDSFSIWLGDKLNISPYKINYILDQSSGGVGDVVLPAMTKQAENNVVEDKFTTDSTMKSKYPGEFYSKIDELKVNSNSSQATDEDILKYKYASSISEEMGKLYNEKRKIQNSDKTDKEKKEQLKEVQEKINKLAKEGLEDIEHFIIKNNTTIIGNNQYYKTINLTTEKEQWENLSEKELEKNKNIKLESYGDYKRKVAKETINQRKNGKIEKNESIDNKSKMMILVNSNYDNIEKTLIYENYIGTQDELYSVVMKNTGININEYLKYKTQKFESDKKDDGTIDGKTINGSQKQKVYKYVNNMKVNYNQRLLLLGTQYKLSTTERQQIANYIKGLNITNTEKIEMYKKMKGFKIYKNGRITY